MCVEALREHQQRQNAERGQAWPDWENHGLVFPSRRGTPMEPDNLRRSWGEIRRAAGLGTIRFHDLRHTCVTLLLDLGAPPHVVREIVGHSDIEVTMTIYAHVSLEEKRKALGRLGRCSADAVAVTVAVKRGATGEPRYRPCWSKLVVRGRVELPTFRFSGGRSYRLSYLTLLGPNDTGAATPPVGPQRS